MKKLDLFLAFIMLSVTTFGQDMIIDFSGTGASSEVASVEVVNLSNCTSIVVPGNGSLNLTEGTVGVEEYGNHTNNYVQSYPNPFENSTKIEFNLNQNDYVTVTVCDITGKVVANYSKDFTSGVHSFEFTANNPGMYSINVSGTKFVQTSKVICKSNNLQQAQLSYNGVTGIPAENGYKSSNSKDFLFTVGDRLKLKGISGDNAYATVMTVEPTTSETYTFNFVPCTDGDGNNYAVIEIGTHTWMAENLKTTSYVGGADIPYITADQEWADLEDNDTDKAYCFYGNDENSVYGALYTYAAATNGDNSGTIVQGVCPDGWHLSRNNEWTSLIDEFGGLFIAGGKLKSTCMDMWEEPNIAATNESGFTALPGGGRSAYDGEFFWADGFGYWWSATPYNAEFSYSVTLCYNEVKVYHDDIYKSIGQSVRCVKD